MDQLEGCAATSSSSLRPIPLLELQAAIEANAPPSPPPLLHDESLLPLLHEDSPTRDAPFGCSTPLAPAAMPPPPPPLKKERKRRSDVDIDLAAGGKFKLVMGEGSILLISTFTSSIAG